MDKDDLGTAGNTEIAMSGIHGDRLMGTKDNPGSGTAGRLEMSDRFLEGGGIGTGIHENTVDMVLVKQFDKLLRSVSHIYFIISVRWSHSLAPRMSIL